MIFGDGLRIFTHLRTTDCDFLNGQPFDVGLIGLARHISTGFCALGAFLPGTHQWARATDCVILVATAVSRGPRYLECFRRFLGLLRLKDLRHG